jgi:hypothetical protein
MSESFVRFMVSPAGRLTRVVAGVGLLGWGLSHRDTAGGKLAAAFSAVPIAAGALDACVLGPVLGYPFRGDEARDVVR